MIAIGGRRLLAAVNPAACAAGLAPGMPLADALSFLPGLAAVPAEPAADAAALLRLAEWCGRYSPWTAPDGTDGVKIEITGCGHLWGGEAALAADLASRLGRQGLTHRIAIAGTLGAAWALARFAARSGGPAFAHPDDTSEALAPLPVEALRLDPPTVAGLRRVGLRRIGELYPMPRAALGRRFGASVAQRLDQALDRLPEPLSPLEPAPTRRVRLSFAEPISEPADLARAANRLTENLAHWLAREGVGARRLDLAFLRVDGQVEHIRLGTARASRDAGHLAALFAARLETIDPGLGVEDMILAAYRVEPLAIEQTGLAGTGVDTAEAGLAPLIDRLGIRLGPGALSCLEARASHIPERASVNAVIGEDGKTPIIPGRGAAANPEPMNTGSADLARRVFLGSGLGPAGRPGMTKKKAGASTGKAPRPVRLFRPPEPIEAMFVVPDDPPFRFTWRRRSHAVARADGPERIAEEWWQPDATGAAAAVRDYYRVEDAEGRRFWLFRAGLGEQPQWFLHGVFA